MPSHVTTLKRVYGAMCLPRALPHAFIPPSDSAQFQEDLMNEILLSPHFQGFPPSREFRRQFWKWVVDELESRGEEVDERIYEAYLDIISAPIPHLIPRPPSPSYNTHFWSPGSASCQDLEPSKITTLLESRTVIEGGTTGLRTWGASLRLADWIIAHPEVVRSRRILELGSGAGFLGLIIAALQLENYQPQRDEIYAPSLTLTDANSEVLSRCHDNFKLSCNNMGGHPSLDFRLLDWSDALDGEGHVDHRTAVTDILKNADIIVGADLVYDATIVPALVAVLALFFRMKRGRGSREERGAYIALTIRREDTVSKFLECLSSHCLNHEEFGLNARDKTHFLGRAEAGVNDNVKLVRIYPTGSPP